MEQRVRDRTAQLQSLNENLHAQLARLNLLDETTRAIGERQDLRRLFQVVLQNLEEHLPIDFGCACLYAAAQQTLSIASVGVRGETLSADLRLLEQAPIRVDESGLGRSCGGNWCTNPTSDNQRQGAHLEIQSEAGVGTTMRLSCPPRRRVLQGPESSRYDP